MSREITLGTKAPKFRLDIRNWEKVIAWITKTCYRTSTPIAKLRNNSILKAKHEPKRLIISSFKNISSTSLISLI